MRFDLVVKNGTVVDPVAGEVTRADVAINAGRIHSVEREIPSEQAFNVLDATGLIVTPGLIDLHSHVYWGLDDLGINAASYAPVVGTTTWVDAGTANPLTVDGFRHHIVERSPVRIFSFLRLGRNGSAESVLSGRSGLHSLADRVEDLIVQGVNANRDIVKGVKISMGSCEIHPLELAVRAAERAQVPLMAHIAHEPPPVAEVLSRLRPGDIVTHAYTGQTMRLADRSGVREEARRAHDRGVLFDVGHGAGSFNWESAESLVGAGIAPDTISTDSWEVSVRGPMFDLPTCLSKFLALGLSLEQVIAAATSRPAQILGLSDGTGTLQHGAPADIALLHLEEGRFPLYDTFETVREGGQLLVPVATIFGGRPLERRGLEPPPSWLDWAQRTAVDSNPTGGLRPEVVAFQQELVRRGHTPWQLSERHPRAVGAKSAAPRVTQTV